MPPEKTLHEIIRELAYRLWEEADKPPNMEWYFWFEAERHLAQVTGSGRDGRERR
jgi:hypothetical protein